MQILSLIFHARRGSSPFHYRTKCQFISPHPTKTESGWEKHFRKTKWLWGITSDTMKEGKVKSIEIENGGGKEQDCWGYRGYIKEENELCLHPKAPSKSKEFHLSLCNCLNLRTFLQTTSRGCPQLQGAPEQHMHQNPGSDFTEKKKAKNTSVLWNCRIGKGWFLRLCSWEPGQPALTAGGCMLLTACLCSTNPESSFFCPQSWGIGVPLLSLALAASD